MSCVVRPVNTIVGSAAIKESILSMKSMPADGKSNSVTGRNRRSSCKGGKCAKSGPTQNAREPSAAAERSQRFGCQPACCANFRAPLASALA